MLKGKIRFGPSSGMWQAYATQRKALLAPFRGGLEVHVSAEKGRLLQAERAYCLIDVGQHGLA